MKNKIKSTVDKFISEQKLSTIDYNSIKSVIGKLGYTIIEYNNIFNDDDVNTIINTLSLDSEILKHNGFTFANDSYRLVFINEDLSEKEKIIVLSHELGHIVCGHMGKHSIIGQDVKDEYEANEFAHYLLQNNLFMKLRQNVKQHKKLVVAICIAVLVVVGIIITFCTIQKQQSYYGEYYVTSSGSKYHKKDCIFVKNKNDVRRMTKEEFETGEYEPCDMCLPNK